MAFIALRQLLDHAAEHGYGVPAFNVNNMEQIQSIMQAAEATRSPVILQASAGARKYAGEPYLRHLVLAALEAHPDLPVVLHQDHGASPSVCQQAIRSGFTSVMMDGGGWSRLRMRLGYRWRGSWDVLARWRRARPARKMAWARRAGYRVMIC